MGFIIKINIIVMTKTLEIIYKGYKFTSAKLIKTNINNGEKITTENEVFFLVDDRMNNDKLDFLEFEKFFEWRVNKKIFNEKKDLENSQYLAFEINNENYYICLHTGHWESSGLIDFLPPIEPFPDIQGRVEFLSSTLVEGFFEEEMFVIFE